MLGWDRGEQGREDTFGVHHQCDDGLERHERDESLRIGEHFKTRNARRVDCHRERELVEDACDFGEPGGEPEGEEDEELQHLSERGELLESDLQGISVGRR